MKIFAKISALFLAVCMAAVACNKVDLENVPLPEGETIKNEPVTEAQWGALQLDNGSWELQYCFQKENGKWNKKDKLAIHYAFSLPDQVAYSIDYLQDSPDLDGGCDKGTDKWSFDLASSSIMISGINYKMVDAGADSFFLVQNAKEDVRNALSSTSASLYKFVRVQK